MTNLAISRTLAPLLSALAAILLMLAMGDRASAQDVQAGLDATARIGGGVYRLPAQRVSVRNGVVVPSGVTLDLGGGELIAMLTDANAAGVRLLSDSTLRNGAVTVVSRGSPGTQAGAHATVLIGALYGENAARLSPFDSPSGWTVSNVTLRSDKRVSIGHGITLGAAAIQVMGGAHDGLIERITVPDSATLYGGVLMDWGTVGSISSGDVPGSAAAFRRGLAYTSHPHDIVVRDVKIGRLTRPSRNEMGSYGVRLSGVHNINVQGITVGETTEAAFRHTAGDLGFEFARPADRARALRGIVVDGIRVARAGAYLVRSDSYSDNVGRAAEAGYRPMTTPIGETDIVVRNVEGTAAGSGRGYGLRIDHQRGGRFSDITARGFQRGFFIDEQAFDLSLERPVAIDSADAAISVEHAYRPPGRVTVSEPQFGGRGANASLVIVGRSEGVRLRGTGAATVRIAREARGVIRD